MFEARNPQTGSAPPLRHTVRASLVILVLALCAGGLSPAAPAQAAQPRQQGTPASMRFYLRVGLPNQLCAGQKYAIKVTPMVETQLTIDNVKHQYQNAVDRAVPIQAEVSGSGKEIATIDPPSQTFSSFGGPASSVSFNLQAKKAGTTFLYLTAKVPASLSNGQEKYFGPGGQPNGFQIDIQNCDYDVTVIYWWVLANEFISWWDSGVLKTRLTATDPEYYGGDGSLDFLLSQYDIACSQMGTLDIPTHISGHYDLDNNKLAITFTSSQNGDAATSCPNSALMSPTGLATGPWAGIPVLFPPEGGTKIILIGGGGGLPPAKVTITLKPVIATGAK